MNFCPKCGSPNQPGARFCEKCGGPLGDAPAQQPGAPLNEAADQAKEALASGVAAVKKLAPKLLIGIGALVVLLLIGLVFFRPMSEKDYEKASEDAIDDLYKGWFKLGGALSDVVYDADDWDDDISDGDIDDMRDDYKKYSKDIKDAAGDVNGLRPPKAYKDADKYMRELAAIIKGDFLKGIDELIDDADGMTYEEFDDALSDLNEDISDAMDDIDEDLSDEFEDLTAEW
jgi:hypothetical protein